MVWTIDDMADQQGRIALVTGANTGLGLETAKALAARGARVLMTSRDRAKGEAAIGAVRSVASAAEPTLVSLDLADLRSVRSAAAAVCGEVDRLDLLINNAGVMGVKNNVTADGFEPHLGTNLLGHFALTGLLLSTLHRAPTPRVVTLGSVAGQLPGTRIRWDDLHHTRGRFVPLKAYAQSKLAVLMFAAELQRRAREQNSVLLSIAAHPGGSHTELMRHNGFLNLVSKVFSPLMQKSPAMGAVPTLYAATNGALHGGEYIGPKGPLGLSGPPVAVSMPRLAADTAVTRRLWEFAEAETGVSYSWPSVTGSPEMSKR